MSDIAAFLKEDFGIPSKVTELVLRCEEELRERFATVQEMGERNQYKVLGAFRRHEVAERHFYGSTGYGYGDAGREKLGEVFADVFGAECALVSPHFMSGTHTITAALFGLLEPGNSVLCVTGEPYDTLRGAIAGSPGSLADFHISFRSVPLLGAEIDLPAVLAATSDVRPPEMVYLQRSTGYDQRPAFTTYQLQAAIRKIRAALPNAVFFVDNCYGEFVCAEEPSAVGADVVAGSLIKNPGGGLAPTGGYIAGKKVLLERISSRYSAPGIGAEIGSYDPGYRLFFQGLLLAPHMVAEAMRGVMLASAVFQQLGFAVSPGPFDERGDITQTIEFGDPDALVAFVRGIQKASAVDAHVVPQPWGMPGYEDPVIMAAGTFIQGASLELTADAPMRHPYSAYLQGGLTYPHAKLGVLFAVQNLLHLT